MLHAVGGTASNEPTSAQSPGGSRATRRARSPPGQPGPSPGCQHGPAAAEVLGAGAGLGRSAGTARRTSASPAQGEVLQLALLRLNTHPGLRHSSVGSRENETFSRQTPRFHKLCSLFLQLRGQPPTARRRGSATRAEQLQATAAATFSSFC